MEYETVNKIMKFHKINEIISDSQKLWYHLAEGIEMIPNSDDDLEKWTLTYEKIFFSGWKLRIREVFSFTLEKEIKTGKLFIKIPRSGKVSFKILPN